MSVLATLRPDAWNLALFAHILGAMVMVGALAVAASYLFAARRNGSLEALRVGFRSLLYAALPAFIVMRVGAQWIADKQGLEDSDATWMTLGYAISDAGALLVIVATVAAGLALRRAGRSEASGDGGAGRAIAAWVVSALIVAYVVAIWAMSTKPV